jgi:hypothetical protein
VNNLVAALNEVFGKQVISRGYWRLQSSSLNPSDFYLWVMLEEETYLKNPHSLEERQERHEISAAPLQQHQCVSEKYSHILRYALKQRVIILRLFFYKVKQVKLWWKRRL